MPHKIYINNHKEIIAIRNRGLEGRGKLGLVNRVRGLEWREKLGKVAPDEGWNKEVGQDLCDKKSAA